MNSTGTSTVNREPRTKNALGTPPSSHGGSTGTRVTNAVSCATIHQTTSHESMPVSCFHRESEIPSGFRGEPSAVWRGLPARKPCGIHTYSMQNEDIVNQIQNIREGLLLLGCPLPGKPDDIDPVFTSWLKLRFPHNTRIHQLGSITPTDDFLIKICDLNFMYLYGPETIIEMSDGGAPPYINSAENNFIIIGSPYTPDRYMISSLHESFYGETLVTSLYAIEEWQDGDTESFAESTSLSIHKALSTLKQDPELLIKFLCCEHSEEEAQELRPRLLAHFNALSSNAS